MYVIKKSFTEREDTGLNKPNDLCGCCLWYFFFRHVNNYFTLKCTSQKELFVPGGVV